MKTEDIEKVIDYMRILCNKDRQNIIETLGETKSLRVGQIAFLLGMIQPTVSHHMRLLRDANIVYYQKQGKEKPYYLNKEKVQILNGLVKRITELMLND